MYVKNYQNRARFDKVIVKIKVSSFFLRHPVMHDIATRTGFKVVGLGVPGTSLGGLESSDWESLALESWRP